MNFGSMYQDCKQSVCVWSSAILLAGFGMLYFCGIAILRFMQMLHIVKKSENFGFDLIAE